MVVSSTARGFKRTAHQISTTLGEICAMETNDNSVSRISHSTTTGSGSDPSSKSTSWKRLIGPEYTKQLIELDQPIRDRVIGNIQMFADSTDDTELIGLFASDQIESICAHEGSKTNTCDQVSHEGSNKNQQSKKKRQKKVSWQTRINELVAFRNNFGHTNVSRHKHPTKMQLAIWVMHQRLQLKLFKAKKTSSLTQERINLLDELKFDWFPRQNGKTEHKLRTIDMTPAQRSKSWRQLTPEQTTELLVVLWKIKKENTFETKDTTSRAVKYLLSAIRHGLLQYPDTCDPKVVQWNGVSKFCINSHIALLIALFMALRNDDDHQFSIEEWDEIHTEVMYGCQNAVDKEKQVGKRGCNSNPLVGSTIKKSGGLDDDGKVVWERTLSRPSNHNLAQIRNSSLQFTGGGTKGCSTYITRTVTGVSIVWPEFNNTITIQAIQDVGKSLMDHLSITDHHVVGKLLEMRHWHSMKYFGHRPVGIYWFHKDGGTLSSITNAQLESVASKGAQWIQNAFTHK